jgi:hypothetical protein
MGYNCRLTIPDPFQGRRNRPVRKLYSVIPLLLILVMSLNGCAAQATKPVASNILFSDDFSKNTSGWPQQKDDSGTLEYANSSYHVLVNKPGTLLLANPGKAFQGDVSIEVDARKAGGSDDNYIGILCHYQNPDNYYLLMITSDGFSGIAMRKDGLDTMISPALKFLKMDGIKKGNTTNHIRADCIGEALTLFANGKQVSLAYNKSLTGGFAGLAVRSGRVSGGVDIRFDNFSVSTPDQP